MKEEIKDKTTEEMELMVTEMNTKKVGIYNALEALFQKFITDSKEKFRRYTQLMEENNRDSKAIEETIKKIQKTKNKIKLTCLKIIQIKKEFEDKNSRIKRENDEIARNFLSLKDKMFRFRNSQRKKLVVLVSNTKLATERLLQLKELGNRLLSKAELCRKAEFLPEKVVPLLGLPTEAKEEDLDPVLSDFAQFEQFKNYLQRYNKVMLDTQALTLERDEL